MADKRRYRFAEEKDSKGGKQSLLLALISVLAFVVCVILSFAKGGTAGPYVGAISIAAMLLAVYAFRIGMQSFGEEGVSPTSSVVGAIISGIVVVGWIALFLAGIGRL